MVLGGIKMKRALTYFVVGVDKEENLYYVINVQRHFVKGKKSCVKVLIKGICLTWGSIPFRFNSTIPFLYYCRCMQRNLGRERIVEITSSEDWGCLVCDPTQIYPQKATYFALYQHNKSPDFARKRVKVKRHVTAKRTNLLSRKADKVLNEPQNFIEENIGMYFC